MQKYKTVEECINDLDDTKRKQVHTLRKIILAGNSELIERIKWNAPSYVLNGEDRITFNLINKEGVVKLVLHMGAVRKEDKSGKPIMKDETGLIAWSSDIRGMLSFKSLDEINSNKEQIVSLVGRWLSISHK
jgi:hypothetical protein